MSTTLVAPTTGIILILFGTDTDESIIVERAPDVTGSAGSYTAVATLYPIDLGGTPFLDVLPLDGNYYWYKAYGSETGQLDSNFTLPVRLSAVPIPQLDLGTKPWLGGLSLQLAMDVVSDTSGSLFVTASINNDPAHQATPVVTVASYAGIPSAPTTGSTLYSWNIPKPITGSGLVIFQNTMQNRYSQTDSITVEHIDSALNTGSFLRCQAYQINPSVSGTWIFVSGTDPSLNAVNISLVSSGNVGTVTDLGTQGSYGHLWTVLRPSSGIGLMLFQVTGSAGTVPDEDYAEIDNIGMWNTTALQSLAYVVSATPSNFNIIYNVFNPAWTSGAVSASVSSSYTPLTGITVTQTSSSDAGGTGSYFYTVTRPNYGQGMGSVTFAATKTGYVPTMDVVTIPEQLTGLAHLRTVANVTSTTNTQLVVSVSCVDPLGLVTPSIAYSVDAGTVGVAGSNPWTLTRPTSGSGAGRVTFTGTGTGRVSDSDAVDVPASSQTTFGPNLVVTVTPGATTYTITWSSTYGTITVSIDNGTYSAPAASPITVTLDTNYHTYDFKAVADGQTYTSHVAIPSLAGLYPYTGSFTIGACNASNARCNWTTVQSIGYTNYVYGITSGSCIRCVI